MSSSATVKSFGFVRAEVDKGVSGGAPGSAAPYVCIGHVYSIHSPSSRKGWRARPGDHGRIRLPNIQPTMQISEIVG